MPINIFVADRQNLFRQGLIELLENKCDVSVIGQTDDGYECLNEVNKLNPNVVILDVDIKGMDGIKTVEIMKEQGFNVKTLVLANDDNADDIYNAVEAGCDGYLLKDCEVNTLKKTIYDIYNGEKVIQDELKPKLENSIEIKTNIADKLNELTRREVDVLKLLSEGMFNKEIAIRLNISERTVKNHISSIFKKIGVNDRTQAAVFAIKNKLINK